MPLVSAIELTRHAAQHHYALGYFESWNLESLQGVLDAAEQTSSPIIIGFNGDFLSRSERNAAERLEIYAALGLAAAESTSVPCAFIFNECPQDRWIRRACDAGFNLVMPADPEAGYEDYATRVEDLARYVHSRGVSIEAELGELPCGATGTVANNGSHTDPALAAQFVKRTGIDLLAVSVGNVHIMVDGEQPLDLDSLAAIHEKVSIPLVLHGGTGITADSLGEALKLGVAKVNYGTYLKQRYLKVMREVIGSDGSNPHELLGIGGDADILVAGRQAVCEAVLERLPLLQCRGKAK